MNMGHKYVVKVVTDDGSVWLLDVPFVDAIVEEHREVFVRIGTFQADILTSVMQSVARGMILEEWLYPNARLIEPSKQVRMIFDGVADVDDHCEDDPDGEIYGDEGCDPYSKGRKRPEIRVELVD